MSNKLSKKWSFPYFWIHHPSQLFYNFRFLWVLCTYLSIFPSKGYSDISVMWPPWTCTFCAAIPHISSKRRTLEENICKTSKTFKKCECFFPNETIKWDCVDPKCFDRKFGRADTQKANSHNTAAWSLILTTGFVFCVSIASLCLQFTEFC